MNVINFQGTKQLLYSNPFREQKVKTTQLTFLCLSNPREKQIKDITDQNVDQAIFQYKKLLTRM